VHWVGGMPVGGGMRRRSSFSRVTSRQSSSSPLVSPGPSSGSLRSSLALGGDAAAVPQQIESLVDLYAHNPDAAPEMEQMAEVSYLEDAILVRYHRRPTEITASFREIERPRLTELQVRIPPTPEMVVAYSPHPNAAPTRNFQLYELQDELLRMETKAKAAVKHLQTEMRGLLEASEHDLVNSSLEVSFYDTRRNAEAKKRREEQEAAAQLAEQQRLLREQDYLSPFLAQVGDPAVLDAATSATVKERCLQDLKERLIARAQLIQQSFEQEQTALQEKQAWYQKHQGTLTPEAEAQHIHECQEIVFRIRILEQRLEEHKQQAPELYVKLDHKLRNDLRLAALAQ
jgi:hypothetical protein